MSKEKPSAIKGRLAKPIAFLRRHWVVIRSSLIFTSVLGVWLAWYPHIVDTQALGGFLTFTARITGATLSLLGAPVEVAGTTISSPDFSMIIGHECTAVVPAMILFSAVVAYPSRIWQKLSVMGIGLAVLFVLNLIRVVTLYYIGVHAPLFFETAHFIVWQSAIILSVVLIWLIWIGRVNNVRTA